MSAVSAARGRETALEPEMEIVDPHHHLWTRPPIPYGPQTPYLMDDLLTDTTSGHNVSATCYVECSSAYRSSGPADLRPIGETEWVIHQRRVGRQELAGIIGYADLRLGYGIGPVLDAHLAAADESFKGIRCRATWDRDPAISQSGLPGLLTSPEALAAVSELRARALSLDVWVFFHQLPDVRILAASHPDVPIVLNHLGSPLAVGGYRGHRHEVLHVWRAHLRELARESNVYVKIGGLGIAQVIDSETTQGLRTSADIAAFWSNEIMFCIETFGPQRCMFESNYPVDAHLYDYRTLWNVFKRATSTLTSTERTALFSGTSRSIYRFGPAHTDRNTHS